jgi:hypothetical protein
LGELGRWAVEELGPVRSQAHERGNTQGTEMHRKRKTGEELDRGISRGLFTQLKEDHHQVTDRQRPWWRRLRANY